MITDTECMILKTIFWKVNSVNWPFQHLGLRERAERSLDWNETFLTIVCLTCYIPSFKFLFQSTYIFSCCNSLSIWLSRTRGWMVLSNTWWYLEFRHPFINVFFFFLPFRGIFPKTLTPRATVEQFHNSSFNCFWHSCTPSLAPFPILIAISGCSSQNRFWSLTKPALLHITWASRSYTWDINLIHA